MKRQLLSMAVLTVLSFALFAQENILKGSKLLGGDIGFASANKQSATESKVQAFNFSPVYGKAVRDNLFIGSFLQFIYGSNKDKQGTAYNQMNSVAWGGGVFARKYKPLKSGFYVFLQANAGVTVGSSRQRSSPSADFIIIQKNNGINLNLTPGIAYNITRKLQLEAGFRNLAEMQYSQTKERNSVNGNLDIKTTRFGLSSSLNNFTSDLYIGFRFMLRK